MRILGLISILAFVSACGVKQHIAAPTFNEKQLETQNLRAKEGLPPEDEAAVNMADPSQSSLWARSAGNPYLIRNQKAQKVGDLLTIIVSETATASTSAKTDTKKDSSASAGGKISLGQGATSQLGEFGFETDNSNSFKGEGKTDRSGTLTTTVQAVVENVLNNGTLFVRGRKIVTINNEDQEVEVSGFVRPDDIRINNTVASTVMADAKIRYVGEGVVSDKQRVGWATRMLDAIWPF